MAQAQAGLSNYQEKTQRQFDLIDRERREIRPSPPK